MLHQWVARCVPVFLVPLTLSAAAVAAPVRYQLTDVQTVTGHYQTGQFGGSGSLLGYFVFDAAASGIVEFIITAVENNAVQFEWSSAAGAAHPSAASSSFNPTTGVWDLLFNTRFGSLHDVTLDLAFRPSDFDFSTGSLPLIPSGSGFGTLGTSSWYEIDNFQYGAFGGVTSGSLAVPEPGTLLLAGLALASACGLAGRRSRRGGQPARSSPSSTSANRSGIETIGQ